MKKLCLFLMFILVLATSGMKTHQSTKQEQQNQLPTANISVCAWCNISEKLLLVVERCCQELALSIVNRHMPSFGPASFGTAGWPLVEWQSTCLQYQSPRCLPAIGSKRFSGNRSWEQSGLDTLTSCCWGEQKILDNTGQGSDPICLAQRVKLCKVFYNAHNTVLQGWLFS